MAKSGAISSTTADFLYDAFYSGAVGGSVVALFFLLIDAVQGQPLFTPSLMGSVLFAGAPAASTTPIRLDMVAYYSVVHFGTFAVVGAGLAFLVHEVELHSRNPGEMVALLIFVLEGGFFVTAALVMPGVIETLGVLRIAVGNLLAAGAMGIFLLKSHNDEAWKRLKSQLLP